MFCGLTDTIRNDNYLEIVDRYGKMRKINDFETVHESLICEYFYIFALSNSNSYKNYVLTGFKNQILSRYKDEIVDTVSIVFIQKYYQINVDLCLQYPSKFLKLSPDFVNEKINKIVIYNEIINSNDSIFISEQFNEQLLKALVMNKT